MDQASAKEAIDIVEEECFLNDFSPIRKTKSRKTLWRIGNAIRDRIIRASLVPTAEPQSSADSEQPVAWRYTCQDGSQVLMLKPLTSEQKRRGYYTSEDGEDEVDGDDATIGPFHWAQETPLYAALQPARTEPQASAVSGRIVPPPEHYVAPFRARGASIVDANDMHVAEVSALYSRDDRSRMVAWIVQAMNAEPQAAVKCPSCGAFNFEDCKRHPQRECGREFRGGSRNGT